MKRNKPKTLPHSKSVKELINFLRLMIWVVIGSKCLKPILM